MFSGKLRKNIQGKKNEAVKLLPDFSFFEGTKKFPICYSLLLDAHWVILLGLNLLIINVNSKNKAKQKSIIDSE